MTSLPPLQIKKDSFRILFLLGNASNFAGDLLDAMLEHWTSHTDYHHVVFIPGPFEYGPGTLCLGDSACERLRHSYPPERLTVCESPVLLEIPLFKLRIVAAPLWPTDPDIFRHAGVYEVSQEDFIAAPTRLQEYQTQVAEAARQKRYATEKTLEKRATRDRVGLFACLAQIYECNKLVAPEMRSNVVVATYALPDEQLCTDILPVNPFRGAVSTLTAEEKAKLDPKHLSERAAHRRALIAATVQHWLVGVHANKPKQYMEPPAISKQQRFIVPVGTKTLVVSNPFVKKESRDADGFAVRLPLVIERK